MRITWTRISLISLLAIALSFVLSLGIFSANYSPSDSFVKVIKSADAEPQFETMTSEELCLTSLQQQKYTAAIANCQAEIRNNTNNLEAHLNLGLAYYYSEDYQNAIAQDRLVVERDSHDYRAFYNWGLVNSARGEYHQAIAQYQTASKFVGSKSKIERALIYNDLGAAWVMLGDYDKAIANLDRAIELDPNSLTGYFNRGCAHHRQGNYQRGIDDFDRVIALDPDYTEAYISRAVLFHLIRHDSAAYRDLDIALQQYEALGDLEACQKIMRLKSSIVASKVSQTG